jgi:glycosyltransferase involved in cell wall biosynthesis
VEFAGAVPNDQLPTYYASADIFVAPSVVSTEGDTEGLGVVILEAAASGLPIVASDIGGITDIVQHEQTGLLVEPGDPQAIALAVNRLINDDVLRQTQARSARELVTRRYSWDVVVDRFDALFRSLP